MNYERICLALVHPTVLSILEQLEEESPQSPKAISETLGLPLGAVSYHVRALATKGLIREVNTIPRRGALEHFYALA